MKLQLLIAASFFMSTMLAAQALKDTQQLREVIVRGQKSLVQQRPDGLVINVQGSILAKGSSVMDVLQRSPGVVLDPRNNSIMLNGKSGVTIMLDGKLMRMPADQVMNMLNSMPANNIASIELLNTPGAAFDAEGNAGVINIITRKNREKGTTANVSATIGQGWGTKGMGTIGVAHNIKRFNFQGSYTFNRDHTYSDIDIISYQDMPVFNGKIKALYRDTTQRIVNNHDLNTSVEFKPDSATTISGMMMYGQSRWNSGTRTVASYLQQNDSLYFDGNIYRKNTWRNLVSSISFEKRWKAQSRLNISVDHLSYQNRQPSEVTNVFSDKDGDQALENDTLFSPRQRGYSSTDIEGVVAKVDFRKKLNRSVQLETGVKISSTNAESASAIQSLIDNNWVNRNETITTIRMHEEITAAYASLNISPGLSTNIVLGGRYEYAAMDINYPDTSMTSARRRNGNFFPNLLLSQKTSGTAEWQLSYSKRITRPSYNDLASYASYSDPTAIYTGNPLLRPAISHTVKLGYNYRNFSFSLLAGRDLQNIARYQLRESPSRDLLYVTPVNIPRQDNFQLQATVPFDVKAWWKMNNTVTTGVRKFFLDHTPIPASREYGFASINTTQTFLLPRNYSAEVSAWFTSVSYNGSTRTAPFGALNLGVKKELNKQSGTLQLSVSDVFRTIRITSEYGTVTREAFDIRNKVYFHTETSRTPVFKISYSKSFGNSAAKARSFEESDRIRKD